MIKRLLLSLALLAIVGCSANAGSTINPTLPAANSPLASATVRNNFGAAFNDINSVLSGYAAASAPPNPTTFQRWVNTATIPAVVEIWDGSQWIATGTVNTTTHTWTPGGAVIPAVTDLGLNPATATGAPHAISLGARFAQTINLVGDEGAVCDGAHAAADTLAFQRAISAASALPVDIVLPGGKNCTINTTLSVQSTGTHFVGQGSEQTVVTCATGGADCIDVGTGSSQVFGVQMSGIHFVGSGLTGSGWMLNVNGAALLNLYDVIFDSVRNGVLIQFSNTASLSQVQVIANAAGGSSLMTLKSPANNTFRSDATWLNSVTLEANYNGLDCLDIDGAVYTTRMDHVARLNCAWAELVQNSAASNTFFPTFIFDTNPEIDGNTRGGFRAMGGNDFVFTAGDIDDNNPTTGITPFQVDPDTGNSNTRGVTVIGTHIHDTEGTGMVLNAHGVILNGIAVFDTNHAASGALPAIDVGANAADITINGSLLGPRDNDPDAPNYIVKVENGAARVVLNGNSYYGATTGNVDNLTSGVVQVNGGIAFDGTAIPISATQLDGVTINSVPASGNLVGTTDAQTLTNKTISGGSNTLSGITNAQRANMNADTVKCNATGGSAVEADCTAPQVQTLLNVASLEVVVSNVNFGTGGANTDYPITVPIPSGLTRYVISSGRLSGANASLTAATLGLFTGPGGTGTALIASGTAITVSSGAENTPNNSQNFTISITPATQSSNYTTLYLRVQSVGSGTLTGNFTFILNPES